jgi:hypothetical protein
MAVPPQGFTHQTVVRSKENIYFRRFRKSQMEGIVRPITDNLQILGPPHHGVAQSMDGGRNGQESAIFLLPIPVCIALDLIRKCVAGDPLNLAALNSLEDLLNRFGLFADSKLRLIVRETVQTTRVEIDFHGAAGL